MHTVAEAAEALSSKRRILMFTGAGISTESGIPDFRGPDGLWKKLDPEDFTIGRYLESEEVRIRSWASRFQDRSGDFRPNAAHHAITDLWATGRMVGCITQNIDGLHQMGGLPDDAVSELHGNAQTVSCYANGHPSKRAEVEERWRSGEADPR
jgi:NAD-dependent deacetylase